jgi:Flp pilus assembly protein TadD
MTSRFAVALVGIVLAGLGLFAASPQKPDPAEAARLNNLGCAYMDQQLFEKGLLAFRQAAALDPKLDIARLNEGIALLNLQKIDEAKAALEEALKQNPKNPTAWYNVGLLAKNTGDTQAAIEAFKRVTELDPYDADTWYFLGSVYSQARQFPQAIESFQHALQINPLHASAEFGLSRAYQQSGDVDHARENLKRFQYITEHKIGAPISLAYGEQGQYSRAVDSPAYALKPPPQIEVQFVDVTKEAGITTDPVPARPNTYGGFPNNLGSGACFLDYDNDGNIDLLLTDDGLRGAMTLYHNAGGGRFEDKTRDLWPRQPDAARLEKFGISTEAGRVHGTGCTAGDYDNDGFSDIAYTYQLGAYLLHNERDGTFKVSWPRFIGGGIGAGSGRGASPEGEEREQAPPIDTTKGTSHLPSLFYSTAPLGVSFIDYDHDGDIDLYVTEPRSIEKAPTGFLLSEDEFPSNNTLWRNNGDASLTDVSESAGLRGGFRSVAALGTDFNNDRAVDLLITGGDTPKLYENPREGKFRDRSDLTSSMPSQTNGVAALDFDHDGWMDYAFTSDGPPALTLWRNNHGKSFEQVKLPETNWARAFGVAAFDYDNDGWVDLVAVGETKEGKGEIKLFRNLGPDGFKDVTADVGLDKIHLSAPRSIITGDYDNDGAVDLLITQNHGPAVLLKNEGGNQNHWLRLALKGLNDNKSAIGTKVEVFAGGNRQKFEIYGSNGYLGQNSPYLTVGLGQSTEADIVRLLWPTGVLQDEVNLKGDQQQNILEIDRRGSSCPTLFVWNGQHYEFVADMLGAGVVGHWIGPNQRDIPRPVEWIKIDRHMIQEKDSHVSQNPRDMGHPTSVENLAVSNPTEGAPLLAAVARSGNSDRTPEAGNPKPVLSFRFMEPLEEAVYLDQVRLLAVDHPADLDVYPNEYFASNPPYPEFKVVVSRDAKPPAGAWDEHGHNVLPDLLAHRYFGDFVLTQFLGFARPHTLTLDLGEPYRGGPLWLLLRGEVEYFSANSMYAASQAGIHAIPPYVEALDANGKWTRVLDDMGFPAGGPRTMTADLTGKLPPDTQKIRITTNLQIYWDSILVDRTRQESEQQTAGSRSSPSPSSVPQGRLLTRATGALARNDKGKESEQFNLTPVTLVRADLEFHGYPFKIEGTPPGNVNYIYEKTSATGPYTRPAGTYTCYGDVLPLLKATDDKLAVFGSGDEVRLDFDPSNLPALPKGWVRDYFFAANGYEKDMDFYAADGNYVAPMPFLRMGAYPYPGESFPLDDTHVNYLLEYNTRHMSGNEQRGYSFNYGSK